MKTRILWPDAVSLVEIILIAVVTFWLYPELPTAFPTHFGLDGRVNGTMDKPFGPWLLPTLSLGLWVILRFSGIIFPGEWRERLAKSPVPATATVLATLTCGFQAVSLYSAFHPTADLNKPIFCGLGAFMIVLGQFYPRLRRNPLIGCRTAFTLSSDENWARTHRFGGYAMTAAGVAMIPLAFVLPLASIIVLFASVFSQYAYSFVVEHRISAESHRDG